MCSSKRLAAWYKYLIKVRLLANFTIKILALSLGFYNNLNACLLFPLLMAMHGVFNVLLEYEGFGNVRLWIMMASGGIFGFAINYLTGLQIQVMSPLTHNISGTAKACAQTILATNWYGET